MSEPTPADAEAVQEGDVGFNWAGLPHELQRLVCEHALVQGSGISPTALLCANKTINRIAQPLLYDHVDLTSIVQASIFVEGRRRQRPAVHVHEENDANAIIAAIGKLNLSSKSHEDDACLLHGTRTFSFTLPGVPGGSTRGGRASALSSPERRQRETHNDSSSLLEPSLSNRRLLLASKALLLCPNVEHCTISMFGVRHSSMLTSADYLAEEASTFRDALAQLRSLKSFSWLTPRENDRFVGFSVAVVDIAIAPLIEGLHMAGIDMQADGRRKKLASGAIDRFAHPLEHIALHHCILPMSSDPRNSIFCLFARVHPDDEDWALFPRIRRIYIRTAIDVAPGDVAFLALFWQLRLDKAVQNDLSEIERYQLADAGAQWDPYVELSDAFVHSIWGPRVTIVSVKDEMETFVESSGPPHDVTAGVNGNANLTEPSASHNPYIRALEESTDTQLRLSEKMCKRLRKLTSHQQRHLIDAALQRVRITAVEGAIAGV